MLLTEDIHDNGEVRVYATRGHTVVSYFAEDSEGGTVLHVEPGFLADPKHIDLTTYAGVRRCALDEAGRRLSCEWHEVELHPFGQILAIADVLPKHRNGWSGRTKKVLPRGGR